MLALEVVRALIGDIWILTFKNNPAVQETYFLWVAPILASVRAGTFLINNLKPGILIKILKAGRHMDRSYIYLIFTAVAGIAFLLLVPKNQYKRYLLYGLVFGGILDLFTIATLVPMNQIRFMNMGNFSVLGFIPIFVPVTWMFDFAIFFYLMPRRKTFLTLYILTFTALSYIIGELMNAYGLFEYTGMPVYVAVLIFFAWYAFSAWFYLADARHAPVIQPAVSKPLKERDDDKR